MRMTTHGHWNGFSKFTRKCACCYGCATESGSRCGVRKFARSIVAIPAMSLAEGSAMLSAWLEDRKEATFNAGAEPSVGRKLTRQQRQNVLASFAKSGSALWLKLAFEEVSKWPSWRKPEPLPTTIHGLIDYFIEYRLLKDEGHPRIFVERALAFITLARFGLSEDELARALGTDENVREEFVNNEKTSQKWEHVSLLPPCWLRLYHDLKPYLGNIFVDGALLMRWFHREFSEVLQKKLLTSRFSKIATHAHLADVFAKMAPGLETLFQDTDASSSQICTSLRRIMEQPWQLAKAKKHDELNNLISGFSFCMAKCAANRSRDLIQDFRLLKMLDVDGTTIANHWRMFFQTRAHLLDLGDEIWPAHRILFQLALEEASESAITLEAVSWKQSGYVKWSHAVSTIIPQSLPPTTVSLISSGHELVRTGWDFLFATPGEGVCYHSELLWGWDKSHLCVWDPSDGCIVRVHHIGDIRGVVPCNAQALVIDGTRLNCSLYDPITGA